MCWRLAGGTANTASNIGGSPGTLALISASCKAVASALRIASPLVKIRS
jgi:hypothetical protein